MRNTAASLDTNLSRFGQHCVWYMNGNVSFLWIQVFFFFSATSSSRFFSPAAEYARPPFEHHWIESASEKVILIWIMRQNFFFFFFFSRPDHLIFAEHFCWAAHTGGYSSPSKVFCKKTRAASDIVSIPSKILSVRRNRSSSSLSAPGLLPRIGPIGDRVKHPWPCQMSFPEKRIDSYVEYGGVSGSGPPDVLDITEACQLCGWALNGSLFLISHSSFTMTPLFSWYYSTPGGSLCKSDKYGPSVFLRAVEENTWTRAHVWPPSCSFSVWRWF